MLHPKNQATPALAPARLSAPVPLGLEPNLKELAPGFTPNIDNLSAARSPASMAKEPTIFVTWVEIEALVRRDREKTSLAVACLSLRPPHPVSITANHILLGT